MELASGDLDRRILLEQQVEKIDPRFNARTVEWVPLGRVWAKQEESSFTPDANPGTPDGVVTYAQPSKYFIRFRMLDKTRTRINHAGRILRIVGTAEIGRREWLELSCKEWAHDRQQ